MEDIFERFNLLNVLIIGDIMMDSYIWGKVDRISPEAPVPVVGVHRKENRLGGAANVALNIQSLGARPLICSIIGDDPEGADLMALLTASSLSTEGILKIADRPTTVKTRIIANKQQVVRVDSETDANISVESRDLVLQKILSIIDTTTIDAIIFEDYDKGLLSEELITEVVNRANDREIITVVDPKKRNFLHYRNVSLFKPNLKELREGLETDIDPGKPEQIEKAVSSIKDILNAKDVMLTLSEHGVFVKSPNGQKFIPAHIRKIADVSGAGDTVIAAAALCMAAGLDAFKTAAISNLAGGLVCEYAGVVPVNKERLLEEAKVL